ncbi:MAG: hypothetical protein J7641_14305 [Cyanobacteria bacterium SID2]|nr:hypothetical protein [Cyanobacteria bacterium SID2]
MQVRRWAIILGLAGLSIGCRAQMPMTESDPAAVELSSTTPEPVKTKPIGDALASICRVVKVSEGRVAESEKSTFALSPAKVYEGEVASSSIVVVRDTPNSNYEVLGAVSGLDNWPPQKDAVSPADTQLVLCLYETNNPNDSETYWYLNEKGWYGALTVYGTDARLYLVEAKTLNLVEQTQLMRERPDAPETYTLKGESRAEIQDGLPLELDRVKAWLERL